MNDSSLSDRFELRTGNTGSYVFDTRTKTEIDLLETLKKLNEWASYVDSDVKAILTGIDSLGGSQ